MIIGRIQQDGDELVVAIPPEDLARYGLAVGHTIAFTPHRVDPKHPTGLPSEGGAIIATFRDDPDFQRALDYLAAR